MKMNKLVGPRGWSATAIDKRFISTTPSSYDADSRTVEAVLSKGSPVARFYGTEVLRIDSKSVVLDRLASGGIPILDSHQQVGISNSIGKLQKAWIDHGALVGKISFHDTEQGRAAEGMVARNEITGISAGYRVMSWEITDEDGTVVDPEKDRIRWDDNMTFTATRWELLECSLVAVPADADAAIRSFGEAPCPAADTLRWAGFDPETVEYLTQVSDVEAGIRSLKGDARRRKMIKRARTLIRMRTRLAEMSIANCLRMLEDNFDDDDEIDIRAVSKKVVPKNSEEDDDRSKDDLDDTENDDPDEDGIDDDEDVKRKAQAKADDDADDEDYEDEKDRMHDILVLRGYR
jgi:hypothetical protein